MFKSILRGDHANMGVVAALAATVAQGEVPLTSRDDDFDFRFRV
jgi:hypothetical protein